MIPDPCVWRRVRAILEGALELDLADRPAYLADTCGADADLRRDVEALLEAHARAGPFMETPAARLLDESCSRPEDLVGRAVGSYRILSRLGAGGIGEVYLV